MSKDGTESPSTDFNRSEDSQVSNGSDVAVGSYTWRDFMIEYGYEGEIDEAYNNVTQSDTADGLLPIRSNGQRVPQGDDWARTQFDPEIYLGFSPDNVHDKLVSATGAAVVLQNRFKWWVETTEVVKGEYTWEHFKWDHYYDDDGRPPRDGEGEVEPFEPEEYLGFAPSAIESRLTEGAEIAAKLAEVEERNTVYVNPELDEDEFFSTSEGHTTLVNRYDLEKTVPLDKKRHFIEVERYWVNKPYSFIILFHSIKENEKKYYAVEPYLNEIESDLVEYLSGKLRTSIKYSDEDVVVEGSDEERGEVLEEEIKRLLVRNNLREPKKDEKDIVGELKALVGFPSSTTDFDEERTEITGITARPEPAVLEEDPGWLTDYQIEKLLYVVRRDFIGYERIDPIKHDINVEDISCDGYNAPVFVYHTDYENLITNISYGGTRLDSFVIKLAQRSGKGISKRQPQVDATLPDGSRAQLTLGSDVSDHGTNFTIRQFKDVPFTPVDLINWKTFSMDEMAFLWLAIESNKSLIFAGGTASGKTTSLNAVSLFIPSNTKIVSIEDTREVELPQRNWVASVTRPSFSQDNTGDIDEFDLLEAALRQRPDYIIMGEVRGEEGRTLFQVMSTGHTTYTTFHADNVNEVLKRFTTDPINVSKTLFTALDLVSVQTQTKVRGKKVRRNTMITEINDYDAENDEISVQDVFKWQPEGDEFIGHADSKKLQQIAFERGWSEERLEQELFERRVILSYLITNDLNKYTEVAATVQAFINDPETILTLLANEELEESLEDLREMESMLIEVDPEKESLVPRPEPDSDTLEEAEAILEEAEERVFDEYRGQEAGSLLDALMGGTWAEDVTVPPGLEKQMLASIAGEKAPSPAPEAEDASTQTDSESKAAELVDSEDGVDGSGEDVPNEIDERNMSASGDGSDNDRHLCGYVDPETDQPCQNPVSEADEHCTHHPPREDEDTTGDSDDESSNSASDDSDGGE